MGAERQFESITFDDIDRAAGVLEAMVSGLDVDTLTGEGATRLVKRLVVHERVVATVRAKAAKRAADANQWRHAGERSPATWLASLTGTTTGQAAAELETTRKLVELPATAAARAAGALSESQARQVADAATADPGAEADLLAHAATDDAAALARRCLAVKAAAERDETAARERLRRARRHRSWTDGEGAFCYAGRGLPEDRAALEAALKPYQDQAFHNARRRGEREPAEAYAYDALIALANHQCPTASTRSDCSTAGSDMTPAPDAGDAHDGTPGRAAGRTSAEEIPGTATLWDGTETGTSTTTAEGTQAAPTDDTVSSGGASSRAVTSHGPPGTEPAGAVTNGPVTDARAVASGPPGNEHGPPGTQPAGAAANGPVTDARGAAGSEPAGTRHGPAGSTEPSNSATTDDPDASDDGDAGEVTGTGADPAGTTSTSGTVGTVSDFGPIATAAMRISDAPGTASTSLGLGPRAKVIVRIDHTALVRGHTIPGEVCEIAGVGPIPVATAREMARDAFLTAVVTDGVDIRTVAHLGRAATAHQRTALEARGVHCAVPGCGAVHHLEIDHVDGWALTRRTHIDHLDWLCRHHHRQKTHHSYRLEGPPGNRTWHPPDTS